MAAPRDRAATEERILAAVGTVLARDGFGAVGVNAIAREAGVDKVLIYRYFGGLPELLQSWGASGRFWPSIDELLGPHPRLLLALPAAERLAAFFERFIDALRARPLTIEILAAETVQRNELTAILDSERQEWGNRAGRLLGGTAWRERPHLQGVLLLWIAGVQYLLVRARTSRIIGGFDLHSDAGWQELKDSVHISAQQLFAAAPVRRRRAPPRSAQGRRSP
ncbi:MAG: TetR/AcrR family transcriptional regulator [Rubrivivax sp.]|nr:TetR/AcrR family transcriptional regulator [Rubrivivax sp.]